ncbi:MAG: tRNA 4-thiouridine(8) synthase ThiI [Mycoplasmataceae bacterium]|nr:tRNA 4-thiouridine(8) synthase ThiI [Mycoplasmataceae bacterium]
MLIIIKYGELVLKGENRNNFSNRLFKNIKFALKEFQNLEFLKCYDNCQINNFSDNQYQNIINIIKFIPGINLIIPAYEIETKKDAIVDAIISKIIDREIVDTFKIETKRKWKQFEYDSMEFSKLVGSCILEHVKNLNVSMKPKHIINIEIDKVKSFFYFEKINGIGGFPVGINGRVLMLISGGIDSPVASALMLKKGIHVDFITFLTPPHTSDKVLTKVKNLIKIVTLDGKICQSKLYTCNFTPLQTEMAHMKNKAYQITIMRRYFYRIAKEIAIRNNCIGIATGESLGQVASQTPESMQTIQNAIGDFLVFKPLMCYDKNEIISLARVYSTYETSILPFEDCCTLFVPEHPVTKPNVKSALEIENDLFLLDGICKSVIENIKVYEKK